METPHKFVIAITNLRGVSTKLNKYKLVPPPVQTELNQTVPVNITFFISNTSAFKNVVSTGIIFSSLIFFIVPLAFSLERDPQI